MNDRENCIRFNEPTTIFKTILNLFWIIIIQFYFKEKNLQPNGKGLTYNGIMCFQR